MKKINKLNHPLIQHKLTLLRDKTTGVKEFREAINEIAMLMCYEATRDMPLKEIEIETPVAIAKSKVISGKKIAIVPILRSGLCMVDGILKLIPAAKVIHIGIYRDPLTLNPIKYYSKIPGDVCERDVIIVDAMIATGGTAIATIDLLKEKNVKNIKFMSILASEKGINNIQNKHGDIDIFCAHIDNKLNDDGYIIPGLGDASDRMFGTK